MEITDAPTPACPDGGLVIQVGGCAVCGTDVKVYRHALILRTVEYNEAERRYQEVMKWQKIDVPAPLRASLHRPRSGRFKMQNYR